jgi:hypothetical protein
MLKTRVFSKVHITMESYSFYFGFMHTCMKNSPLKAHKYKPKKLLKIDGLLMFYYLILPKLQKNTKEYGLWVIFFHVLLCEPL